MYYMQSVKHALCRHVPKNGLQTDTNFPRVESCSCFFAEKTFSLCSAVKRRCLKTNMGLLSGRNSAILQTHRECVPINIHFILASNCGRLVGKNALIWCLRNDINPRAILSLHPTICRDVMSRCIFHHTVLWIISPIRLLIVCLTTIAICG